MATLITPYTDINATMRGIHKQVCDSIQFYCDKMPFYNTPQQMFDSLKQMVTYKNDPPGVELLQTVQTLMTDKNYWGIKGAGDCDCFSILILTACCCHNWNEQRIVLAGRSKVAPVHIWTEVKYKGKWYCMDLTQKLFNTHRPYKFIQYLYV
jgi:hypothetical protein